MPRMGWTSTQRREIIFFNDTAATEIYTLSLHDSLPIWLLPELAADGERPGGAAADPPRRLPRPRRGGAGGRHAGRSEEHKSELQSRQYFVCRLLFLKKSAINVRRGRSNMAKLIYLAITS